MKTLSTIAVIWLTAAVEFILILCCQYAAVYGSDWILAANKGGGNWPLFACWVVLSIANLASAWLIILEINE